MTHSLRIIFAGTPNFAAYQLHTLLHSKHQIIAVLTQSNLISCKKKSNHNSVKNIAIKHNLPIFQPKSLQTSKIFQIIDNLHADILVVVAYGLIFPQELLHLPRLGCINMHCSLLPRWRGAAPIQRALEAGDSTTGITIIQMDKGLDTGNILYKQTCNISSNDTNLTLSHKLAKIGSIALLKTLNQIDYYKQNVNIPQNENYATYAKKISKQEGKINWYLTAIQIERRIRAFNPWPTSYFKIKEHTIKVWKASVVLDKTKQYKMHIPGTILKIKKTGIDISTGDGILTIILLQPTGKRIMTAHEFFLSRKNWFTTGLILP
ncbi:methionyl-tRNA formyltransferase [Blochmannia endosymbiont of Camponotus (Colobopsis) obliquus]|uniref:methionyl-tRNA formyltransferase n=1 Tax=Blochmannia endosymbiont of Camponotus (Colobopsis) obliquus TaxID=1505597 RepID=UPI00061A79C0|nr:methionyl-tRNA formyltransferase [Blochmannia endosymbiont of Camponotus (Colobopsis) obliquus]AKC60388.1 methionyl-tRNA formyltransferase [Blochmannia endosymbiont of Camponotus (Colobopsis) obliquus]